MDTMNEVMNAANAVIASDSFGNGRLLSALPELDVDQPLQSPDQAASLLGVLKPLPANQKQVTAQFNIDQGLEEDEQTLHRITLNKNQDQPADEHTIYRSKPSVEPKGMESARIHAFLDIVQGEQVVKRIALKENYMVVGRRDPKRGITPGIDLTQFDPSSTVSRQHARIRLDTTFFSIEDLKSRNKTRVGELTLTPYKPEELKNGDVISFGAVKAIFRLLETSELSIPW
ncbi:MAG TPA: FHA domain-containing protein [Ktedonobacteraceae bacterium]|nr:FHA domain-containing protein [Ktedonobacteraceae bacterium]